MVQIWSLNTPESGPNETLVLQRVENVADPRTNLDVRLHPTFKKVAGAASSATAGGVELRG